VDRPGAVNPSRLCGSLQFFALAAPAISQADIAFAFEAKLARSHVMDRIFKPPVSMTGAI
jgi:hypothetical protein